MSEQNRPSAEGLSDAKRRLFELLMQERQGPKVIATQNIVVGDVAITPPQAHEFAIPNPDRHIFNLPLLLEVYLPLDAALLTEIVRALLAHHDALRLCSAQTEHGWRQWIAPPPAVPPITIVDLSALDEAEQRSAIEAQAAALQQSFDLASGPLFKAALFDLGAARPARLLLLAHHIACDQYSAGILAEDFVTAYRQLRSGEPIALPAKTTSYLDWSRRLADYAHAETARAQLTYWLNRAWSQVRPVAADFRDGINLGATSALVVEEIDIGELEQLSYQRLKAHTAQLHHVIIYALARALTTCTGGRAALISMCQHGRVQPFPDLDVSRTVGWFSYQYPLLIDLEDAEDRIEQFRRTVTQTDSVPQQGLSYGVLRYMGAPDVVEALQALPEPDLFLNIRTSPMIELAGFAPASEDVGETFSRTIIRPRYWYLNVNINDQRIEFQCAYNTTLHRSATVERFIKDAIDQIYALDAALATG